MCAMCHFVAVPAVRHIVWLTQHSGVARVHVWRIAVPADMLLPPSAAHGAACAHRRFIMEFIADAGAAQTTSTGSCWHEKGAQSMQVRACMRMLSPPNDSAMCSLACQRGFLWLTGYPTLVVTFF